MIQNTDRQATAESLLVDVFKSKANFIKLLSSYVEQTQEIENALFELKNKFWLNTAEGAQLDGIGEVIGVARGGATDAQYRIRIGARIRLNLSSGTPNQILELVATLLPEGAANPRYSPYYPASFVIDATDTMLTTMEVEEVGNSVISATPAGVQGDFVYTLVDPDDTFELSESDTSETSDTQGFGHIWETSAVAEPNGWSRVAYSPTLGLYAAVSTDGTNRVMTSPDGETWTSRSASEANTWRAVCWAEALGLFVAVASDGTNRVMTSPDGITWTARSAAEANAWRAVCWASDLGLLVAVASSGTNRVMTSTNGITWTAQAAASADTWLSVIRGDSIFVAVGTDAVMTSPDGVTWTSRTPAGSGLIWRAVAYSPTLELYAAVASLGTDRVMTSPDGITWTGLAVETASYDVVWSTGLEAFVSVGFPNTSDTTRCLKSTDGVTWESVGVPEDINWTGIVEGDGRLVAVASTLGDWTMHWETDGGRLAEVY